MFSLADLLTIPLYQVIIFLDVDGTIVPDSQENIDPLVPGLIAVWQRQGNTVYLCSNSPQRQRIARIAATLQVPIAGEGYRKPSRPIADVVRSPHTSLVVIGDRLATDGLFAWRIGAQFVLVQRRRAPSDRWFIRLLYWLDDRLRFVVGWRLKASAR